MAVVPDQADGGGRYPDNFFMGNAQQEYFQQGGGGPAEQIVAARVDITVANLEALIEGANVILHILSQDGLVEILDQHFIQLA